MVDPEVLLVIRGCKVVVIVGKTIIIVADDVVGSAGSRGQSQQARGAGGSDVLGEVELGRDVEGRSQGGQGTDVAACYQRLRVGNQLRLRVYGGVLVMIVDVLDEDKKRV